jgi:hypothetical protein
MAQQLLCIRCIDSLQECRICLLYPLPDNQVTIPIQSSSSFLCSFGFVTYRGVWNLWCDTIFYMWISCILKHLADNFFIWGLGFYLPITNFMLKALLLPFILPLRHLQIASELHWLPRPSMWTAMVLISYIRHGTNLGLCDPALISAPSIGNSSWLCCGRYQGSTFVIYLVNPPTSPSHSLGH